MFKLSQKNIFARKAISSIALIAFFFNTFVLPVRHAYAQELFQLPQPGALLKLSPAFTPPLLKGVKVYPDNPFRLDFILDKGTSSESIEELKTESIRLIKYFLASVTVPENDLWVNLSPYEKDRIIPNAFGVTEMGRDLLAQDYILKQLTASVIYPEEKIGKEFWDRVYEEARKRYGTEDIPIDTFNKVWIVPAKAIVYESKDSAYIVESRLKVLLEEDYLALEKGIVDRSANEKSKETSKLGSEIVREVIIPILEKEVNEGKNFAQLRQVYQSLILAIWFKDKVKESLFGKAYVDQEKTGGVDIADKAAKDKIWTQYVEAFKKGAFDYIKEDYDPATEEIVARKYFSGGAGFNRIRGLYGKTGDRAQLPEGVSDSAMIVESNFKPLTGEISEDAAMGSEGQNVLSDEGHLATSTENDRRLQELYRNEIGRLLGNQKSEIGKLLNRYNLLRSSLSSALLSEEKKSISARLAEVEAAINGIIDGINKFKSEGEEDLEIPELPLIDEMPISAEKIDYVKRLVLDGQYVPLFFFAGSMTRMRTSLLGIDDEIKNPKSLYVLEVGTALKEFVKVNPPSDEGVKRTIEEYLNFSGRNLIPMGPRQLMIYRGYIEKLAREKKIKQEVALAKQKIVIAVNEKNEADIFKDIIRNEFYGFSRSNVLFVSQEALNGYLINDKGEVERNENSEKFPFGPAIPIKMLAQEGAAFTLEQDNGGYKKAAVSKNLVDFLGEIGGRYIGTHRVNDLTKFTLDTVLPEKPLAYAVEMIDKGNNAVAEMVRNYEGKGQKGAYLFKKGRNLIILEDPKIRGNQRALDLIEGSSRGGKVSASYSAFRVVYDLKALKDVVNSDTNWNLRFTGGNLYLESYSGDMTLGSKARTAGFKVNDDVKIHDLKAMEIKQLEDAARVLLKSDEDIQEIVWSEGGRGFPIERADGYKIVRYLSGGSKSRVMLIERDRKLLVRKEERRYSGDEKVKLMDEISFLKNLPASAKKNFIEIKDSYIPNKEGIVWYEMPYYSPDKWMPLESMIIKGMITPEQTMEIIKGIISSLTSDGLYEEIKPADKQEYIDKLAKKLRQRMGEAAVKSKEFMQINGRSAIINGKEYPPLNVMLREVIGQFGAELAPEKLYKIHGDLFPENILVNYEDLNNLGTKPGAVLLDPKGGTEGQDLYYELAKMGESIIGLYGYALREYDDYFVGYEHLVREGQVQLDYMVKPTQAVKNYNDISRLFVEYLESSDNPIVKMTGGKFQAVHYFTLLAHAIASTIPFNIHGYEFPKQSILMYIMATKILDQIRKGTVERVPDVVPLDSPLMAVGGSHSKVVSVLHKLVKNGDHILIGFDIDGTLRDHNEERVRDSMIYHVMELSKRTGPQIDVFINTGNDLERLKKLFLERYHTITTESGFFDPNYYIYLTVQEAAKTYKYYPVSDKYELLYTADVISPGTEAGVRAAISDLMQEFHVFQTADQIQNQGGVRIKFTPPGVNAGAEEREDFFRKDQREGLRVKYQEYLIPRLKPLGLFPYIKGRTSIDIMPMAINKRGGIRQLSSWVAQESGKPVRSLMFDDEATELADSVDLLLWVGAKRPSEDIKNVVFNGKVFGTQATANFIYEIIDYISNELIPKDEDAAVVAPSVFWGQNDVRVKELIANGEAIDKRLSDNIKALQSPVKLMASICVFLNQSPQFEKEFHQLQMSIARILDDQEKLNNSEALQTSKASYVDPRYAHITLIGSLLREWGQLDSAREDLQKTLRNISRGKLNVVGPHLMEGLSVIYEFSAADDQWQNLRQGVLEWAGKYNEVVSKDNPRGYYDPRIFHASVVYFKQATRQQLVEINNELEKMRQSASGEQVPVGYINIVKGLTNRTFAPDYEEKETRDYLNPVIIEEKTFSSQRGDVKVEITTIDLQKAAVDLYVDDGVLGRDFTEPFTYDSIGMGLRLEEFVEQRTDKKKRLLVAFNGAQPHWESILLHVVSGNLIAKTNEAKGLFQEEYSPVNGKFWFLAMDSDNKALNEIEIVDGRMKLPNDNVLNTAIAGVPLVLNGKNMLLTNKIKFGKKPAIDGWDLLWSRERRMAMSAIGYNEEGELVRVAVFDDITIDQFVDVLMRNHLRDAILLGTSADVKTWNNMSENPIPKTARHGPESFTGKKERETQEKIERPLGTYMAVYAKEDNKLSDKAMGSSSGGIDLTRDKVNLKVQNAGQRVQFNFDPAMIQQLQNASGLEPVIINIYPMTTTVPMFLTQVREG